MILWPGLNFGVTLPSLTSSNILTHAGVFLIVLGANLILNLPSFPLAGMNWLGSGLAVVLPTYMPGRRSTCSTGDLRLYRSSIWVDIKRRWRGREGLREVKDLIVGLGGGGRNGKRREGWIKYYRKEDFGCSKRIICGNVPIMSQRYCPYSPSLPLKFFLKKNAKSPRNIFPLVAMRTSISVHSPSPSSILPHVPFFRASK